MKKVLYFAGFMFIGLALLTPGLAQTQPSSAPDSMQTVEKPPCGCPVQKHHHKHVYKHHVKWHMKKASCPNKDCMNKPAPQPKPCPCQQ